MTWDAFISYSHSVDGRLAPALQSGLHRLARPWYRPRALHVFRDRTALSADPSLWDRIVEALDDARYLVLLMSPQSAGSTWVNREIAHWLETKGVEHLLPVLTEGGLEWDGQRRDFRLEGSPSLPPALRGAFREEPRWVDLRWAREGVHLDLRNAAFLDAVADLAAPIHGKPKDELVGEDVRRHRQTRRVVEAVVVTLAVLLAAAVWSAYRAEQRRIDAVAQRLLVESRGAADRPDLAFLLAGEAYRMRPSPRTEGGVMSALQLHQERELRRLWRTGCTSLDGSETPAYSVLLLTDQGWIAYGEGDGVVAIADTETGAVVRRVALGPAQAVQGLFSDPGRGRILAVTPGRVFYLPLGGGAIVSGPVTGGGTFLDAAYDPRTARLALAQLDGPLEIWDLAAGERRMELAERRATSVAFHPSQPILFAGTEGSADAGSIVALSLSGESETLWQIPDAHRGRVLALAVSPDGTGLLSGGTDGVVRLWDAASGTLLHERRSHTGSVWDLGFSINHPRGSYLASVGSDGEIDWLDARSWMPYPPTRLHQGRINDIDFAANGTYATAGSDGVVALFDADRPALVAGERIDLGAPVSAIAADPGGEVLAVAYGGQGQVATLEARSHALHPSPFVAGSSITTSAYHPSGRFLALGTGDGRVLLWSPGAGRALAAAEHGAEIVDLAFHPDGGRLVSLGNDQRVLQWDVTEAGLAAPKVLDTRGWRTLTFSHDGALLAVGRTDGSVGIIATVSGEDAAIVRDDPPIFPTRLAFHPLLPLLAAGDGYGQVRFWDGRTFAERAPRLSGHRGEINGIAFDVGRNRLITAGRDAQVRLWELEGGAPVAVLGGHQGVIRAMALSMSSSEVVSGGLDGLVILRGLEPDRWIEDGCRLYGRDFTRDEAQAYGLESGRGSLCQARLLCPPVAGGHPDSPSD
jgi:WD40 repeat protein